MARYTKLRSFWVKHKLGARLKVLIVVVAFVFLITPLRNVVIPGWPHVFRDLSTIKVARIHVVDLFFYVDRSEYTESCDFVKKRLENVKMPKLDDMPHYSAEEFLRFASKKKRSLDKDLAAVLNKYQPSLTGREQQMMLFAMLSTTQALSAFNISYYVSDGTLIGYWRHHGLTPWDDDVDMFIDSEKWPLARKVLSCLPDLELNMGSDYMWKLFHKDAELWQGESFLKFPFIDVFLYRNDSEHVWPLTIWLKPTIIAPVDWVLPPAQGVFEGWPIAIPRKPVEFLRLEYGSPISDDCYSRTFMRRERYLVPKEDRSHLPCSVLKDAYPFVSRQRIDQKTNTVLEERVLLSQVLSSFNTSYRGVF
ncbi:uncharacterized protein LOC101852217 [Aplysia californica]|uniref:Uncharacterized protein LOC101852217 n=1 Tax=Aplysia californica TaxID=6500 RepID=A0ABM0K8G5_APLCA|nr:uncharacterized protein LOC101852217 [Aplysia californica]XP_012945190.1 uncharacterized protein LOC101852217 [Aplysia californica]